MKPLSIFALVDEESKFPQATDITLLSKLNNNHGKNVHYLKPKSDINTLFGINHFAGVVFYDTRGGYDRILDSDDDDDDDNNNNNNNNVM